MRYSVGLVCCVLVAGSAFAQPAGKSGGVSTTAPPLGESDSQPPGAWTIAYFRQLLAMSPPERERALLQRPPSKRQSLQAKITEYSALQPGERETRLRMAEIWYYLQPLMTLAPAQRADKLAAVPEPDRSLIEDRLKLWDQVPDENRKKLFENELAIQYFLRLDSSAPSQREQPLNKSSEDWKTLNEKLQRWRALPQEKRQRMYQHFEEFLEMPEVEREKTLHALSDEERQKLEKSLQAFAGLPAQQRAMCIESFRKLANLSKDERDQFLKNAERWQEMSPRDRQTWINLINLLPAQTGPPLPPGVAPNRLPPGMQTNSILGTGTKTLPKLPGSQK